MKIYAFSGLGADQRVFQYLTLNHELIVIDWISPIKNESLTQYVLRLSKVIDTTEEFCFIGVSFGGVVATEMSKLFKPKRTILISSAQTKHDLGVWVSLLRKVNFIRFIPSRLFDIPKPIARYLFGTENPDLLHEILDDTDLEFAKWAVDQMFRWENIEIKDNVTKIGGSKDKMMPSRVGSNSIIIEGGTHFMIVDKAKEVSTLINKIISVSSVTCRVPRTK